MSQSVADWFDPNDPVHMGLWIHLEKTGVFRREGLPEDLEFPINWQIMIIAKLARYWTNLFPVGENPKVPIDIIGQLIQNTEDVMEEFNAWDRVGWPELERRIKTSEETLNRSGLHAKKNEIHPQRSERQDVCDQNLPGSNQQIGRGNLSASSPI